MRILNRYAPLLRPGVVWLFRSQSVAHGRNSDAASEHDAESRGNLAQGDGSELAMAGKVGIFL